MYALERTVPDVISRPLYAIAIVLVIAALIVRCFDLPTAYVVLKLSTSFTMLLIAMVYANKKLGNYVHYVAGGVFFSLIGDAVIAFPEYFNVAVGVFTIAQFCFLRAVLVFQGISYDYRSFMALAMIPIVFFSLTYDYFQSVSPIFFVYATVQFLFAWQAASLLLARRRVGTLLMFLAAVGFIFTSIFRVTVLYVDSLQVFGLLTLVFYWYALITIAHSATLPVSCFEKLSHNHRVQSTMTRILNLRSETRL